MMCDVYTAVHPQTVLIGSGVSLGVILERSSDERNTGLVFDLFKESYEYAFDQIQRFGPVLLNRPKSYGHSID